MPKLRVHHHSQHQSRTNKGKYIRKCGSLCHDDDGVFEFLYELTTGSKSHLRKLPAGVKQTFIDKEYIKKWTKYICNVCVEKGTRTGKSDQHRQAEITDISEPTEIIEPNINNGDTNSDENVLESVCERIGKDLEKIVKDDIAKLYKKRNYTLDELLQYDPQNWLNERPKELLSLLMNLCQLESVKFDDKKSYLLAKLVEQMYHLRNTHILLPLSLRENVLFYSLTSSKRATNFVNSIAPAGSYRTILRCLDSSADSQVEVPKGVCRIAFDNNQVVGKTYVVSGDNKVPTSVMCTTAYMHLESSDLQANKNLKSDSWMWNKMTKEQTDNLLVFTDKYDDSFRQSRDNHISKNISEVVGEVSRSDGDSFTDKIDEYAEKLSNVETEKVCIECGAPNDKTYRICRNCRGELTTPPDVNFSEFEKDASSCDPYAAFTTVEMNDSTATVSPGEPYFVNPNSYTTIVDVLRNIGRDAGIVQYGGQDRSWIFLECDGLPYKIMRDVIDNVWLCTSCKQSYFGEDEFEKHMCHVLGKSSKEREFSWIVPVVGLFHLELNIARSFLSFNWEIFISTLARSLGFRSEKAQQYFKKGSDHHKTWQFLEIIYLALSKELVHPYVLECLKMNKEATVSGYWEWSNTEVRDPNYLYMQQMVFTYLHALMMLRTGTRRNNVDAINAAKTKLFHLVYSGNHPRYQDILFRDMQDQVWQNILTCTYIY